MFTLKKYVVGDEHKDTYKLLDIIGTFTEIEDLNFSNRLFNSYESDKLSEVILKLKKLHTLSLPDTNSIKLIHSLKSLVDLTYLDISYGNLYKQDADTLFLSVSSMPRLRILDVSGNHIGEGVTETNPPIIFGLRHLSELVTLDLSDNKLNRVFSDILSCVFPFLKSLTKLHMHTNSNLLDGESKEFLGNLGSLTELRSLDLRKAEIGLVDTSKLFNSISKLVLLQILDISSYRYRMSETTFMELTDVLKNHLKGLTCLKTDTFRYALSRDLTESFCDALCELKGLTHLAVELNIHIDNVFYESLWMMKSLLTLEITRGEITLEKLKILSESLRRMPQLTDLNLEWNAIGDEGFSILSPALKSLHCLKDFNFSRNFLGYDGLCELLKSLSRLNNLTHLRMNYTCGFTSTIQQESHIIRNIFSRFPRLSVIETGYYPKFVEYVQRVKNSQDVMALMILYGEGFFVTDEKDDNSKRFFRVTVKLPLELQMRIINFVFRTFKDFINTENPSLFLQHFS